MIDRRYALGSVLVAGAFALGGCGMMDSMSSSAAKPAMAPGEMSATLKGSNEVPPNSSGGSGSAKVNLSGNSLTWTITYSGTTGPVTAGHFHGPATASANAGVVVPFPASSLPSPITGSATLTDAQVADLKAGKWYINLHTAANPGGELRGQVN
ncbi:MAG TPA: CHRD domain-containing protein [Caldimonas sp.]|nr:CHRD domain-containing protein [Caldimonas sp.]